MSETTKNIDKLIDSSDVLLKTVIRRSSEPLSANATSRSVEQKRFKDSKVLSNSFAFDDEKKFLSNDRVDNFVDERNPVKRIPTQVCKILKLLNVIMVNVITRLM